MAVPAIAWFAVLVELSRPAEGFRSRATALIAILTVAVLAFAAAAVAGNVDGPLRLGHWLLFAVISVSSLGAMIKAVVSGAKPGSVVGFLVVATLFFALGNAILIIPLGLVPSWLALASTGFDVALLGVAVAIWDAFDEGQALRADMRRSVIGTVVIAIPFAAQALIGLAVLDSADGHVAMTVLLFTSLAVAVAVEVLAGPLAGIFDRLAFFRSPELRADREALRATEAALPLRSRSPLDDLDDGAFARLTRRALGHYADLSKPWPAP